VIVGVMIASTFYIMKDISLGEFETLSIVNILIIAGTTLLLHFTKIASPLIVMVCLLLGFFF